MPSCKHAPTLFQLSVTIFTNYSLSHVNPSLYKQLVGVLLYLTHIVPNINFVVGLIPWFFQNPHESH
jgi:hypothetical protein